MSAPKAFHLTETSLARGTSLIEASAEKRQGKVTATYIGGTCVAVMQGVLDLA